MAVRLLAFPHTGGFSFWLSTSVSYTSRSFFCIRRHRKKDY